MERIGVDGEEDGREDEGGENRTGRFPPVSRFPLRPFQPLHFPTTSRTIAISMAATTRKLPNRKSSILIPCPVPST
jgi:hypothetical protein